jgi:type VI protein secretion system component VasK
MKIYDMMTQRKGKDDKKFYQSIGTIFESEYQGKTSMSGYLNTNPDVKVFLFERKPKEQTSGNVDFDLSGAGENVPF